MARPELSQKYLKAILNYDPDTGVFTWRVKRGSRAMPGTEAGRILWNGYRSINLDGKHRRCHKLAWLYVHGEYPKGDMDHINGDRADNRIENLRPVTRQQNCQNMSVRNDNTSGVVGVSFHKALAKWRAYIAVNGKQIHLGVYDSKTKAVSVRKQAEKRLGFHENHGRAAA